MSKEKLNQKKSRSIKRLLKVLEGDGFNVEVSDETRTGKSARGDINLTYERFKYPVAVSRKENLPTESLEKEKEAKESSMLIFRKNRQNWKVYMDLETLEKLLLHNKS